MLRLTKTLLLLLSLTVGSTSADNSDLLYQKLSVFESLHSTFVQQSSQDPEIYLGELWLAKPNRFRIVTTSPWEQVLVSDGNVFWNYEADLEQLVISSLEQDMLKFPILLFSGTAEELQQTYTINTFADEESEVFYLKPQTDQQVFQSMTLVFTDDVPDSIVIVDAMDQITEITFQNPRLNAPLTPALFKFMAPDGVDVVDQRAVNDIH